MSCTGNPFPVNPELLECEIDCCTLTIINSEDSSLLCSLNLPNMTIKAYGTSYQLFDGNTTVVLSQEILAELGLDITTLQANIKACRPCPESAVEMTNCICTEMRYVLEIGETIDYAGLLAYFEANGTFDDGSIGATGINSISFGTNYSMESTYNGNTSAGTGAFTFGDYNDYNNISEDVSITNVSDKAGLTIAYSLYKCETTTDPGTPTIGK